LQRRAQRRLRDVGQAAQLIDAPNRRASQRRQSTVLFVGLVLAGGRIEVRSRRIGAVVVSDVVQREHRDASFAKLVQRCEVGTDDLRILKAQEDEAFALSFCCVGVRCGARQY
jgi:hypothetical protein